MNDEYKKVFIPSNIEAEKQIFSGLGMLEVSFVALFGFISLIICLILNIIFKIEIMYLGAFILITLGGSYAIVKKDENGMSFFKMMKYFFKFYKSVKKYKYKYRTDWFKSE